MKSFASDNYSGINQEVMQALQDANQQHMPSYGEDPLTEQAMAAFQQQFGDCKVNYAFTGTAANTMALYSACRSYHGIICADSSHINNQEVGAVEAITGCKLLAIPHQQGKISAAAIGKRYLEQAYWGHHVSKPKAVSISQTTEFGTVYSIEELKAIKSVCEKYDLLLHMDGCRLANAAAALDVSLAAITKDVGVDILSFGGTKNGLLCAESVVYLNQQLAQDSHYIQKQLLQLHSKMRFISAQFLSYFDNELWHKNAQHANEMCHKLTEQLTAIKGVNILYPTHSNQIFVQLPPQAISELQKQFPFYIFDENKNISRLVTSFDTTEQDVNEFVLILNRFL